MFKFKTMLVKIAIAAAKIAIDTFGTFILDSMKARLKSAPSAS